MQTWALFVDSYRLLLSRKLFWITLVISALVVILYASIGFTENGWYILFGVFDFQSDIFKAGSEWAKSLYLGIFSYFIVGLWLTWAATILALVSTSPIYNDFMADGSIDLVLAKPISRVWVFVVKYIGSLLFVILQVSIFALGVFLCVGWRVGDWNWAIFWCIPIITIFFSYLYCFNVLMTMLTRSSMAAFLLTILFWVVLFGVDRAERLVNQFRIQAEVMAEFAEFQETMRLDNPRPVGISKTGNETKEQLAARKADEERQEKQRKERIERNRQRHLDDAAEYKKWRDRIAIGQALLPKTKQTTDFLGPWMDSENSMEAIMRGEPQRERQKATERRKDPMAPFQEIQARMEEDYANRSPWYVIGSSLAFEFVVLAFACFLFYRRDF